MNMMKKLTAILFAMMLTLSCLTIAAAEEQPGGRHVLVARGECTGHIASRKLGEGGFGYDPVFIPDGYEKSFAELGTDFKNTISHRAKALAELERLLG